MLTIRVQEVAKITSNIKSWLYADQLLKPEEFVMYRPPSYGGLGILNVKYKAMAGLIKTFLETAGNDKFRSSLYHTILYKFHVLGDSSLPNPGIPPFYSKNFFEKIRQVHQESPLNIFHMSEKEWYRLLLEDSCTMETGENGQMLYIKCRVERAIVGTDWEQCWRMARLPGLGPENVSFLFRLIHQTLPTQERVARTKPTANSKCKTQGCQGVDEENLSHAMVFCPANDRVGLKLLECLRVIQPGLQVEAVLRLELQLQVDEDLELPAVWLIATVLRTLWNLRQSSTKVKLYLVRAQLEAEINLLRETRYNDAATKVQKLAANLLQI